MDIRNANDLRLAYWMVYTMADTVAKATGMARDNAALLLKTSNTIKELKRNIRAYNRAQDEQERHVCVRQDCDGYVELYELPDVADPVTYFEENEYLHYVPSQYDCTGQAFTCWYKVFKRRGRNMVYHCVGFDV